MLIWLFKLEGNINWFALRLQQKTAPSVNVLRSKQWSHQCNLLALMHCLAAPNDCLPANLYAKRSTFQHQHALHRKGEVLSPRCVPISEPITIAFTFAVSHVLCINRYNLVWQASHRILVIKIWLPLPVIVSSVSTSLEELCFLTYTLDVNRVGRHKVQSDSVRMYASPNYNWTLSGRSFCHNHPPLLHRSAVDFLLTGHIDSMSNSSSSCKKGTDSVLHHGPFFSWWHVSEHH